MIKAILFDLDGVLVDACRMHAISFNKALKEVSGFELSEGEHLGFFNGLPTKKKLERLIEMGKVKESDKKRIFQLKQAYTIESITETIQATSEKRMMHEALAEAKLMTACVTNSIQQTAEMMLKASQQLHYLKFVLSNESVQHPKPHPEGYRLAMKMMGVEPEETLIIEDSPHGIESGVASGGNVMRVEGPSDVNWDNIKKELVHYGY
jgi:beta-phosphoglucomutase